MSEAVVEPAADEASVGADGQYDAPAAEPATETVEAVEAPEAAEQVATDWRSDPEVADFIRAEVEALVSAQTQRGVETPAPEGQGFDLDLFADDGGQKLAEFIRGTVQEAIRPIAEPLAQQREQAQAEEGKQLVADAIASIDVGGDFNREAAAKLFNVYKDEAVARYGVSNRALEYAAEKAAREQRAIEEAAEKRGAERYKNELASVGGARHEPAAAAAGIRTTPELGPGDDEMSIAARWGS